MTPHRGHAPDRRYGTIGQKLLNGSYSIIPDQGNDAVVIRTPIPLISGMRVYYFDVYSQGGTRIAGRWGDLPPNKHRADISARQEVYPGQSRNVESTRPADAYSPPPLGGTLEGILRKTDLFDDKNILGIIVFDPEPKGPIHMQDYFAVLIDRFPNSPNSAQTELDSYYHRGESPVRYLSGSIASGNLTGRSISVCDSQFENDFSINYFIPNRDGRFLLVPLRNLHSQESMRSKIPDSVVRDLLECVERVTASLHSSSFSQLTGAYVTTAGKIIGSRTHRDLTEFEREVRAAGMSTFAVYDPSPDLKDVFPLGLIAPNGPELDGLIDELSDLGFGQCEEHCSRVRHNSGLVGESRFFYQDFRSLVQSNAIQKGALFVPLEYLVVFNPLNFMYVPEDDLLDCMDVISRI